ncbi:TetR/AcrR family transcriptional regulator C-terminal domain-containing protein [Rhodococcus opacus]|uniref:TetR/AcrR family transcriptional regulator C-terminal domain-containing protein n=1 Tax=Rhodococcus opacus TaxID=37919 RepID=UPI001FF6EBEE|nr:TetR/AcrR family transcriptional regulator C-terminal domain-containing protein [Rhodococcus opacus]UOT05878.1 TetR/AcrR family transcriptional regulator C-terminal domain-containing protein [Rhodococcus opacus]
MSRSRSPPGISRTTSPCFGRSTRRLPFPASRARRLAGGRTAPCQHALADAFARLDAAGLLRVDDPRRAAHHFALLVGAEISERTFHGAVPLGEDEVSAIVTDGVAAFLDGYRGRGN